MIGGANSQRLFVLCNSEIVFAKVPVLIALVVVIGEKAHL